MKREYIKTGKCIWCGRTKEDGASFDHVPHILPKALGGQETCTDVCNDCNSFFGDDRSKYGISQDEAVKGILQVGKHYFSMNPQQEKSPTFNYFVSKHKISLKRNLHVTAQGLTRQFKRGMCECFLQKYHYMTNDGNSPLFDKLRKFARYDEGNIPFYCVIGTRFNYKGAGQPIEEEPNGDSCIWEVQFDVVPILTDARTYLMRWNPSVSSFTEKNYKECVTNSLRHSLEWGMSKRGMSEGTRVLMLSVIFHS